MVKLLPLSAILLLSSIIGFSQATTPYTTCPDATIAIVRSGTNSDTQNPYYLYNVNNSTGAMTQVSGGPYKDPANPSQNLQVNAIGLSTKDGYIYGLTNDPTVTTTRFLRLDRNYGVTVIGNIPSPSSPTGSIGIINSAAGEVDQSGNYYFTAFTANPGSPPGTLVMDKFFLGKISDISSLTAGGSLSVTYYQIDVSNANCSNYISSLSSDPNNSGLKDFSYNAATNSFFSYATYKNPGASKFSGQLIELRAVTGSNPLRYQLFCSSVVNEHTAEVSGTAIDKNGRFSVLFTDGSFSIMSSSKNVYTGGITQVATNAGTGLPNPLRGDMASCGQQTSNDQANTPFASCPNGNFIIARAGMNADNNPYYIYSVNTSNGTVVQMQGGPLLYPNTSQNLQVNGVGINVADGFFYGLASEGSVNTARFVKFDALYGVTTFGTIAPPTSSTGMLSFVNSAAGDIDRSNNYYFTAVTANQTNSTPSGLMLDKLYLGRIANISNLAPGATPTVVYYEINYSDANCSAYINSFMTDPNNSGLKDFVFNPFTNTFMSYVTYKPTGVTNFIGQFIELRPIAGTSPLQYRLTCSSVTNTHTAEVSGTLVDNTGNFLVLMTDGTIGKIQTTVSYQYNGTYVAVNNNTGLPNPLRGDMASCSGPAQAPLPVKLSAFTVSQSSCNNIFKWSSENEVNFSKYELEQSTDNVNYTTVSSVKANVNGAANRYQVTVPTASKQTFYRLKMIDNDGRFSYSNTLNVSTTCAGKFEFAVSPNPVVGTNLNLNWSGVSAATQVDIIILNATGSVVSRMTRAIPEGVSTISIPVHQLPAGSYMIKAIDSRNNQNYGTKFIKQ